MRLTTHIVLYIIGIYESCFNHNRILQVYGLASPFLLASSRRVRQEPSLLSFGHRDNIMKNERKSVFISTVSPLFAKDENERQEASVLQEKEERTIRIAIPAHADNDSDDYPSPLHSIHIHSNFLTTQQSHHCLSLAQAYADETSCWDTVDEIRHVNYGTADFSLLDGECPDLMSYLKEIQFHKRIFEAISNDFGLTDDNDDNDLCLTYLDLFCVNYKAKSDNTNNDDGGEMEEDEESTVLDRLEPHRDGSLFSFTVLLSTPKLDFTGGGTYFDALSLTDTNSNKDQDDSLQGGVLVYKDDGGGIIRPSHAGDAVLHTGKTYHGAEAVGTGQRTVLVGFVDIAEKHRERFIRPNVLRNACRDWGRLDTSLWRYRRHSKQNLKKSMSLFDRQNNSNGARTRSSWLFGNHNKNKQSPPIPLLPSVHRRRADPTYQRQQRLKIEDIFLRNILLLKEERPTPSSSIPSFLLENEDITELSDFLDSNDITIL